MASATSTSGADFVPTYSKRILSTDSPCIAAIQQHVAATVPTGTKIYNMAQGQVHWGPPEEVLDEVCNADARSEVCAKYNVPAGMAELREALREKLRAVNGLEDREVLVTAGCNQAFLNVILAVADAGDEVVVFRPTYFNHMMALQMTGTTAVVAPCKGELDGSGDLLPAVDAVPFSPRTRAVAVVSPNNPTGVVVPPEDLQRLADECRRRGVWLICDETYEQFLFEGSVHRSPRGPNVINLHSFSKAYGMAGWRVGYIAYPGGEAGRALGEQMLKVQDTVPICASGPGQRLALRCLTEAGPAWVAKRVAALERQRALVSHAVSPLYPPRRPPQGTGALYFFVALPKGGGRDDDHACTRWLVSQHHIITLPGYAFGMPGHVRISYANLDEGDSEEASEKLHTALAALASSPTAPWL